MQSINGNQSSSTSINISNRVNPIQEDKKDVNTLRSDLNEYIREKSTGMTYSINASGINEIQKASINLRINLCLCIALEAVHYKVNFPDKWPDESKEKIVKSIQEQWPGIQADQILFYNELMHLIGYPDLNGIQVGNGITAMANNFKTIVKHRDTAGYFVSYRKYIGNSMTNSALQIYHLLDTNIINLAKNIEFLSRDINPETEEIRNSIVQALEVVNKKALLPLNKINKRISELSANKYEATPRTEVAREDKIEGLMLK